MAENTNMESIKLGPVEIQVATAAGAVEFYTSMIGLELEPEEKGIITLGSGNNEIIKFIEKPELGLPPQKAVGLYHLAIVFPTQASLAKVLHKIYTTHP